MSDLLDYMYKENIENKVRYIGRMINITAIPDEVVNSCVIYINRIFEIIENKKPNNNEEYDELIFSLVDVILLKHLKLAYIAWLKDNTSIDK